MVKSHPKQSLLNFVIYWLSMSTGLSQNNQVVIFQFSLHLYCYCFRQLSCTIISMSNYTSYSSAETLNTLLGVGNKICLANKLFSRVKKTGSIFQKLCVVIFICLYNLFATFLFFPNHPNHPNIPDLWIPNKVWTLL